MPPRASKICHIQPANIEDGTYVIQLALPGVDPKNVEVP